MGNVGSFELLTSVSKFSAPFSVSLSGIFIMQILLRLVMLLIPLVSFHLLLLFGPCVSGPGWGLLGLDLSRTRCLPRCSSPTCSGAFPVLSPEKLSPGRDPLSDQRSLPRPCWRCPGLRVVNLPSPRGGSRCGVVPAPVRAAHTQPQLVALPRMVSGPRACWRREVCKRTRRGASLFGGGWGARGGGVPELRPTREGCVYRSAQRWGRC